MVSPWRVCMEKPKFKPQYDPWSIGWPMLGILPKMGSHAHRNLASMASSMGATRLMAFSLGSVRVVITSHPETAKEILCGSAFSDRPVKESASLLMFERAIGFVPSGKYWRHLRKIVAQHMFSPKRVLSLECLRQRVCDEMMENVLEEMNEKKIVELRRIFQKGSLRNVMESVFGSGLGFEKERELGFMVKEGYELIGEFQWGDYFPIRILDFTGVKRRCHKLTLKVRSLVGLIVEERRREGVNNTRNDFLSILLSLPKEDQLTDADMVAVLWDTFKMNSENQVASQSFETQINEDIDVNSYFEATSEVEKINDDGVDLGCDAGEGNNASIMGKVFDTPEDAYNCYNDYAFLHVFGIRIRSIFTNKITKEHYRKIYVCNKEGFKRVDDNTSSGTKIKRRRDVRTGCKAMIRISKKKDGKWFVDSFNDTHNHDLSMTPTKVMKHRSHGKFHRSMECKSLMVDLGQAGLRPCQVKKVINTMKSTPEADVTSKQCADVLSEERKHYKGKEFYELIKHFQDKALVDNDQYFVADLCEDGCPRNVFWADGRSRDAFTKFGDVVVFDVTYMTNKFKMPFAPFIGVNHHCQSILFGGALLENEKEETFEWLFEHFLKCMFSKYPKAIITDQDKAMGNAIKKVFPNTRHRFCAWHIKKHEHDHLRSYVSRYSDFQELYTEWVKSDTIEEFENRWEVIRTKYNLESNCWITDMYNQRIHWAKAFLKDIFLAGMTTSGRSESIHSFFDGFVNSRTMLNEFVVQYDKAVESRRAAEEDEDFKTMNSTTVLSSVHPIEAKAVECYTRKVFEIFKKEWKEATSNLSHKTLSKSTEEIKYRVGQVNVDEKYWRIVTFHSLNKMYVTCSCAKYETYGILCKHSLYVMKKRNVETLPSHYILPRWTLNARYKVGNGSIGLDAKNNENGVSAFTLWCVRSNFNKLLEQARDSHLEIEKVNQVVINLLDGQAIRKKTIALENTTQGSCAVLSQVDMMPQIFVRDPLGPTNTKGRPKIASRIKSSL